MSSMEREIAIRMQRIRLDKGLSQSDLGRMADIPYQTISALESGSRMISTSNLVKIAAALQVPLSALQPQELDQYSEIPDSIRPLFDKLIILPDTERRKIQQVLTATLDALTKNFTCA